MGILSAEKITNLYLYGQDTVPADLTDVNLIRPKFTLDGREVQTSTSVDVNDYMTNGPGRFASAASFEVVKKFFDPWHYSDSNRLTPGTYSKEQMFAELGLDKDIRQRIITIKQAFYDDGKDDFVERAYVWNTTAFKLTDDTTMEFVIDPDGNRHIKNFGIVPYSNLTDTNGRNDVENFDFKSTSASSVIAGFFLEPNIDPSGIGRMVTISFEGDRELKSDFTYDDYVNSNSTRIDPNPLLGATLAANFASFTDRLFQSGSTRFLDNQNRPILYGTEQSDATVNRTYTAIFNHNIAQHRQLQDFVENGIVYITGTGNDKVLGTDGNDAFYGGQGNDSLIGSGGSDELRGEEDDDSLAGGRGDDTLIGGKGDDLYIWNAGDGNDKIIEERESDGKIHGWIKINDSAAQALVAGGTFIREGTSNVWKTADGSLTLTHNSPWKIITPDGSEIQLGEGQGDFQDGDYGIHLREAITDTTTRIITGDKDYGPDGNAQDELGNPAGNPTPGSVDDLQGSDQGDHIQGLGGNDSLWGGAIQYSHNATYLSSADMGDDILEGGDGQDIVGGWGGNDRLYAQSEVELSEAITQGRTQEASGAKGEWLNGGIGDDIAVGGADNDALFGADGKDILVGGGGDDVLDGDDNYMADDGDWTISEVSNPFERLYSGALNLNDPAVQNMGAADVLYGGAGNDFMHGINGDDVLYGEAGNDVMAGDNHNDMLLGGDGDDKMTGDYGKQVYDSGAGAVIHGDDYLDGGAGNDFAQGEGGNDDLFGGSGEDELWGDSSTDSSLEGGDDYLDGEDGADKLMGQGGDDVLFGGADNDQLFGDSDQTPVAKQGDDYLDGEDGDDILRGYAGKDDLFGGAGKDALQGGDGDDYIDGETGEDTLDGGAGNDILAGGEDADQINAGDGDDMLEGGAGDDLMFGDGGNDVIEAGDGGDQAGGGDGDDQMNGGAGIDTLLGDAGNDVLFGGEENDQLQGGVGSDELFGETGNDGLLGEDGDDLLDGGDGDDQLVGGEGFDQLVGGGGSDLLFGENGDDSLTGGEGDDQLVGGEGLDQLDGGAGNDLLFGGGGNDTLDGGEGTDYLDGGEGDDTYVIHKESSEQRTTITDSGGENRAVFDFAMTSTTYDYTNYSESVPDIRLVAVAGNNTDYMLQYGKNGEYEVYVHDGLTRATIADFAFSNGVTMTRADIMALAPALTIIGGERDDDILGGKKEDSLEGGDGGDRLTGGGGADNLSGGLGDDTYVFNLGDGQDQIVNAASDHAASVDAIELGAGITVDDVVLNRSGNDLVVRIGASDTATVKSYFETGNAKKIDQIRFADGAVWDQADIEGRVVIAGATAGDDTLSGFSTNDILHGLDGNDSIYGNGGNDQLHGDNGADYLVGGSGDDLFDGGQGNDTVYGYGGSDTYLFRRGSGQDTINDYGGQSGDVDAIVMELGITPDDIGVQRTYNQGSNPQPNDLLIYLKRAGGVLGWDEYVLVKDFFAQQDGHSRVEQVKFADGTIWDANALMAMAASPITEAGDTVLGYAWDDNLNGLGGDDSLNGLQGNDTLAGGTGNDTIKGGDGSDILSGGAGIDQLDAGTGNDTLDGGGGSDTLKGGAGNDTYLFGLGSGSDRLYETNQTGGSVDTIKLNAGIAPGGVTLYRHGDDLVLSLAGSQDQLWVNSFFSGSGDFKIEQISFDDGTAWDLNTIHSKVISGTANAMTGTAGNDVFVVDHILDTVSEGNNQGTDTIQSSVTYTASQNVENLTLTGALDIKGYGNALNNVLHGNSGNNELGGGQGDDSIYGGGGNDYLSGGDGNDTLRGEDGDDTLNGGKGADNLHGGKGDDIYVLDWGSVAPTVVEAAGEGIDTVETIHGGTLAAHVENMVLISNNSGSMTGNSLNNLLVGNAQSNTIDGGAGIDTMLGEAGDDTYIVDHVNDQVIENDGSSFFEGGNDVVRSYVSHALGANLENLVLLGNAQSNGAGNDLDNTLNGSAFLDPNTASGATGNHAANILTGGKGDDLYILGEGDSIVEYAGEGIDTVKVAASSVMPGDYSLDAYANVENLALTNMAGASNAAGNDGGNSLRGNAYDNILSGGAGDDAIFGGDGNDTLNGGTGNDFLCGAQSYSSSSQPAGDDTYIFGRGDGHDVILDYDPQSGLDTIQFKGDIVPADLVLSRVPSELTGFDNLVIDIKGSNDRITVMYHFFNASTGIAKYAIERFAFADGTSWDHDTINMAVNNHVPTLVNALADQEAQQGVAFSFTVPADSFADMDDGDSLTYTAGLADGSPLSNWLSFDAATRTFIGTPGNGDAGNMQIVVTATDGTGASVSDAFALSVANVNDAPTVAQLVADQSAQEEAAFSFTLPAGAFSDIDAGDTLTYAATLANGDLLPSWLSFNAATRTFTGTPAQGDVGDLQIVVTVTDGAGASVSDEFALNVAPIAVEPPEPVVVDEQSVVFQGTHVINTNHAGYTGSGFIDINGEGAVVWPVNVAQAGTYELEFRYALGSGSRPLAIEVNGTVVEPQLAFNATGAWNAWQTASLEVELAAGSNTIRTVTTGSSGANLDKLTVTLVAPDPVETNTPPQVIHAIADQMAQEDGTFDFIVPGNTFSDAGDTLAYGATLANGDPLPSWLSFNAATRQFSGTPGNGDVGNLQIVVTATDSAGASVSDAFALSVANVNDAPAVAQAIADQSAQEDTAFSLMLPANSFSDVDAGDTLTYGAGLADGNPLPSWLNFDAATRAFSGMPAQGDAGTFVVRVTATDTAGTSVSDEFMLNVAPAMVEPIVIDEQSVVFQGTHVINTNHAGYTGSGFIDINGEGAVVWPVNVAQAGTYELEFRYALGSGSRPLAIEVNGTMVEPQLAFNATGAWNVWQTASLEVELAAGSNTIRTVTTGSSGANLDKLTVTLVAPDPVETNTPPQVIHAIADQGAQEAQAFDFIVPENAFSDADAGDTLSYDATLADGSALPGWLSFDAATRAFSGTPAQGDAGTFVVRVMATDTAGTSVSDEFMLNVAPAVVEPIVVDEQSVVFQGAHLINTNHAGYTGSGFIDINGEGAVVWPVNVAQAGTYELEFRYALGSGSRPLAIEVNGTVVEPQLAFNATGAWNVWQTASLEVELAAGSNTIRTVTTGSSGANLDKLTVSTAALEPSAMKAFFMPEPSAQHLSSQTLDAAEPVDSESSINLANDVVSHDLQIIGSIRPDLQIVLA